MHAYQYLCQLVVIYYSIYKIIFYSIFLITKTWI